MGRAGEDGTTHLDQSFPWRLYNLGMQSQLGVRGRLIAPSRNHTANQRSSPFTSHFPLPLRSLILLIPGDKTTGKYNLAGVSERSAVQLQPAVALISSPKECSWLQFHHPALLTPWADPFLVTGTQNAWVGKALQSSSLSPLPQTSSTSPGCSELHPTWSGTFPGMGLHHFSRQPVPVMGL